MWQCGGEGEDVGGTECVGKNGQPEIEGENREGEGWGRTEKATRKSGRENIELWNIYRRLIERNKLLYFCAVTHGRISDDRLSGEVISKGCYGASAARVHTNCSRSMQEDARLYFKQITPTIKWILVIGFSREYLWNGCWFSDVL